MIDLSVSGIGFHKNVPVKMEKKIAVPGKPLKRKLPGTDEEEKCEKNKRRASNGNFSVGTPSWEAILA
jgi:hypothetical protein